jgi:uncharacterized membrane protein
MEAKMKQRYLYALMTLGGGVGVVAAFLLTLEKLTLLQNKDAVLTCNINSVFSCTNVLNSWQASVFGFPNSIMCLVLFVIFAVAGAAGLAGGTLTRGFRLGIQGLSLFTLGFALWYLGESVYVIGNLCIYCIVCFAGLLAVNGSWLRINAGDLPFGKKTVQRAIRSGADIFGWLLLVAAMAIAIALRFT